MREIPLTRGFVALIDDEDFPLVGIYKWHVLEFAHARRYATRTVKIDGKRTSQYMHSLITGFKLVDHIDHNGLNNQRENLREATYSQNHANRRKTFGTSKYKGVYLEKRTNKWVAKIHTKGKSIYLGTFVTEEDAAREYNRAALVLFDDYSLINNLDEGSV